MSQQDIDIRQLLPTGALLQGSKYRVDKYLSSGNFGNTYIVTNTGMGIQFAMKEFFLRNICFRTGGHAVSVSPAVDPEKVQIQRDKFKKEAQRLYGLTSRHLVHVYDMFEENNTVYYVMDFVKGESLASYMERTGQPLSEEQVRYILDQLLDGLEEVHEKQIWHLDLKPDNIMIDKDGKVVIIDFGASKQVGRSGKYTGTSGILCYTPGYAPVEQVNQNLDSVGPWTDIYALGATLFNLLTGIDPSMQNGRALQFPSQVSPALQQLITKMTNTDIDNRPQSIAEVRQLLSTFDNAHPSTVGANSLVRSSNGGSRPWLKWGSIAAAVATAIGLSVLLLGGSRQEQVAMDEVSEQVEEMTIDPSLDPILQRLISNMVYVEGGTFTMGATAAQQGDASNDESPTHQVTLSDYSIGKYEVTQEEWEAVMGTNPSYFIGVRLPVENVSWNDCQDFIRELNRLTGKHFRLPTEAEWEFAARGGNRGVASDNKYSGSNELGLVAWYSGNNGIQTRDVGGKSCNELGLYDMSGNVWEWCQDWYGSYSSEAQTNPKGPSSGSRRVNRGCCWHNVATYCRVSNRNNSKPTDASNVLGFRLAL